MNLEGSKKPARFSKSEDELLIAIRTQNPKIGWVEIASYFQGRTSRQCRDRWANKLNPHINNAPWSNIDDQILNQKVSEFGHKWAKIAEFLPGRSESQVKNRWYSNQRKVKRALSKNSLPHIKPISNQESNITNPPNGLVIPSITESYSLESLISNKEPPFDPFSTISLLNPQAIPTQPPKHKVKRIVIKDIENPDKK